MYVVNNKLIKSKQTNHFDVLLFGFMNRHNFDNSCSIDKLIHCSLRALLCLISCKLTICLVLTDSVPI